METLCSNMAKRCLKKKATTCCINFKISWHLFQGSHSTKVEAVVRCLLRIKRDDPTAKALVFSTVSLFKSLRTDVIC